MTTEPEPSLAAAPTANVTGARISAAVIDLVLMIVFFVVMAALIGDFETGDGFSVRLENGPFLLCLALLLAYYFALEASTGQTIGKKVTGLKVVASQGPLTPRKAAIRTVLRLIDFLPFFYLVALIAIVASPRKQRLGDMAAGTAVVRA